MAISGAIDGIGAVRSSGDEILELAYGKSAKTLDIDPDFKGFNLDDSEIFFKNADEVGKSVKVISRPTWRQSEIDAAKDYPDYDAQKSFINGKEVPYGTKGSVRPDYYKDGFSVDIKNYNIESSEGRNNLVRNIKKQYYQRVQNLPEGTKQSVLIDVRSQDISGVDLSALTDNIIRETDGGIEVLFKTE